MTASARATYRIDSAKLLVVVSWPAMEPDLASTRATIEGLLGDRRLQAGFGVLSDWRLSTGAASATYIQGFIDLLKSAAERGVTRWATVVPATSTASYGAGRMAEIQSELQGLTYRVFREYDEALHWLTWGD